MQAFSQSNTEKKAFPRMLSLKKRLSKADFGKKKRKKTLTADFISDFFFRSRL